MRLSRRYLRFTIAAAAVSFSALPSFSQGGRGAAAAAVTAKAQASVDLTGQWVAVVTEDWRWRMITPAKGDYASVPINAAGRKLADSWDPAKDEASGEACKAYGAAGVMRLPGRVRISWADDETLKLETDAGTQTRLFYFKEPKSQGGDWQGVSQASWETVAAGRGQPNPTGALKVVTSKMRPGYLRKNGVPYSDKAVLTEYFDRTKEPNGDSWLVVTTVVDDPAYLNQSFIISSHFRKETDLSKWNPTTCMAR